MFVTTFYGLMMVLADMQVFLNNETHVQVDSYRLKSSFKIQGVRLVLSIDSCVQIHELWIYESTGV